MMNLSRTGPNLAFLTFSALSMVAAVLAPSRAYAEPALADLEAAVRCSAVFGIVAAEQARGLESAHRDYPPLAERGREFFVQTGARLMDVQKLDRPAVQQRMQAEVSAILASVAAAADPAGQLRTIMAPCLALLDATVPQRR